MIKTSKKEKRKKNSETKRNTVKSQSGSNEQDEQIDKVVRPKTLGEIIGRAKTKKKIRMMIKAATNRKESVDHMLFYGPPGLGKTTFAMAIAKEMGGNLHVTSGPAIQRQGDLATMLTALDKFDVLFIDEIHRLRSGVEEILYPAMEDQKLDIVVGKGVSAKTLRLNLKPFTLIGATTRIGLIGSPMRDRFGLVQRLDYFADNELSEMLLRAAGIWQVKLTQEAMDEIAKRSRGTGRIALRLLRRVRDYLESYGEGADEVSLEMAEEALDLLGIDKLGLEDIDHKILDSIANNFNGGPVGLSTLAASISEDVSTIADVYEPFLMQCGLIKRTSRGRVLTEKGRGIID
ncbi:Holliday junction branch migration DNA helicase RuvB [Candidatus Dojkabacteria bacterium]|nr:Holliday junction branch migration DNA helicase RuvB [Candidatus Dojkabacteria bacterium]